MAKKGTVAQEIEKLREEIRNHEELYYVLDNPQISDAEYDALLEKLVGHEFLPVCPGGCPVACQGTSGEGVCEWAPRLIFSGPGGPIGA